MSDMNAFVNGTDSEVKLYIYSAVSTIMCATTVEPRNKGLLSFIEQCLLFGG